MTCTFEVGQILEFDYPAANYIGARRRMERRRILVEAVRPLATAPLDPITLEQDPGLARGSVLITGLDLDRGAARSFYAESMVDVRTLASAELHDPRPLKIAIVEDGAVVHTVAMADPRQGFLEAFHYIDRTEQAIPQPVSLATFFASSRRRAE